MASRIYLSLGTNLGQRHQNLQRAIDALGKIVAVESISSVYETAPWGVSNQPDYLNICLAGRTNLNPEIFLSECKKIETDIGRIPGPKWGPRLIDIDLIFFDKIVIDKGQPTLPHPHFAERAFVLVPLTEIAGEFKDPITAATISELVKRVDVKGIRKISGPEASLRFPISFSWGVKTYVMGILNVTPDSFSGDGLFLNGESVQKAVEQAESFVSAGVDIVDIGGESTRPGSRPLTEIEELERIQPVIQAVRTAINIPISVDTYRANVAQGAISAGADWINDVWGLKMDPQMAKVVEANNCPIVIMHNRSRPRNVEQESRLGGRYTGIVYNNLISDIKHELNESIDLALKSGVPASNIIIDPGIGFGKTVSQNIKLLNELDKFKDLGYPILVGPSRKSFIGFTLDLPPDDRLEGTAATVAISIDRGADIVRVHDVKAIARVARMTDRIVRQ